jgi:hypothetical protein
MRQFVHSLFIKLASQHPPVLPLLYTSDPAPRNGCWKSTTSTRRPPARGQCQRHVKGLYFQWGLHLKHSTMQQGSSTATLISSTSKKTTTGGHVIRAGHRS